MIMNKLQNIAFAKLASIPEIQSGFYFTGGTALSECHLNHRVSVDIDLFSESPVSSALWEEARAAIARDPAIRVDRMAKIHDRYTFEISGYGFSSIVDLVQYPYGRLESSGKFFHGIPVDSMRDIWVNKWAALLDRKEPKDVLDIACLVRFGHMGNDVQSLENTATDVRRKFGLPISPAAMVAQFRSRISTTQAERAKGLLYKDPGKLDVFSDAFPENHY